MHFPSITKQCHRQTLRSRLQPGVGLTSTSCSCAVRQRRSQQGTTLVELPVSIWMVFVVFLIPMIALASITMRSALFNIALQDAVQAAAKTRTFETNTPDGPSAVSVARDTFEKRIALFSGIDTDPLDLDILQTGILTGVIIRSENKLVAPADNSNFIYQVEGAASANLDPLFPFAGNTIGRVPGLTSPIKVRYTARQMFENPQGLHR